MPAELVEISLGHQRYSGPASCSRWSSIAAVLNQGPDDGCRCVSCEAKRYALEHGETYEREQVRLAEIRKAHRRARPTA